MPPCPGIKFPEMSMHACRKASIDSDLQNALKRLVWPFDFMAANTISLFLEMFSCALPPAGALAPYDDLCKGFARHNVTRRQQHSEQPQTSGKDERFKCGARTGGERRLT